MKKIVCSLLIAVLISVMLVPAVFAAGTSVTVGNVADVMPGAEVTLDVTVTGNTGFGAATMDIVYDADVLTLTAITVDGKLFGQGTGVQNVEKNRVNCANATAITGDGVLFTLTFKVADDAAGGKHDVTVEIKNFADTKGADIDATVVAGFVDVHVCTWNWVVDEEATCGKDGTKHQECACGAKQAEGTKIPATGEHTWNWVVDEEATCGKDGTKHQECDKCGAKQAEGTKIPATGEHNWIWVTDKEPSAIDPGVKHQECDKCGAKQNENTTIPNTGDSTFVYVAAAVVSFVALVSLAGAKKKENVQ